MVPSQSSIPPPPDAAVTPQAPCSHSSQREAGIDDWPEPPVMAEGVIESGVLVMARQGIPMDAAAAVRADHDALADRSLPR